MNNHDGAAGVGYLDYATGASIIDTSQICNTTFMRYVIRNSNTRVKGKQSLKKAFKRQDKAYLQENLTSNNWFDFKEMPQNACT